MARRTNESYSPNAKHSNRAIRVINSVSYRPCMKGMSPPDIRIRDRSHRTRRRTQPTGSAAGCGPFLLEHWDDEISGRGSFLFCVFSTSLGTAPCDFAWRRISLQERCGRQKSWRRVFDSSQQFNANATNEEPNRSALTLIASQEMIRINAESNQKTLLTMHKYLDCPDKPVPNRSRPTHRSGN